MNGKLGDDLQIRSGESNLKLRVAGILETGGSEDDKIVAPLEIAQQLSNQPDRYRQLYVSALTKPEDDFGRRDPASMNPEELERWSCTPYVSSIAAL